ncbi:MAG: hypothetical protein EOO41_02085, partial [Methanobacteriota archaeon]
MPWSSITSQIAPTTDAVLRLSKRVYVPGTSNAVAAATAAGTAGSADGVAAAAAIAAAAETARANQAAAVSECTGLVWRAIVQHVLSFASAHTQRVAHDTHTTAWQHVLANATRALRVGVATGLHAAVAEKRVHSALLAVMTSVASLLSSASSYDVAAALAHCVDETAPMHGAHKTNALTTVLAEFMQALAHASVHAHSPRVSLLALRLRVTLAMASTGVLDELPAADSRSADAAARVRTATLAAFLHTAEAVHPLTLCLRASVLEGASSAPSAAPASVSGGTMEVEGAPPALTASSATSFASEEDVQDVHGAPPPWWHRDEFEAAPRHAQVFAATTVDLLRDLIAASPSWQAALLPLLHARLEVAAEVMHRQGPHTLADARAIIQAASVLSLVATSSGLSIVRTGGRILVRPSPLLHVSTTADVHAPYAGVPSDAKFGTAARLPASSSCILWLPDEFDQSLGSLLAGGRAATSAHLAMCVAELPLAASACRSVHDVPRVLKDAAMSGDASAPTFQAECSDTTLVQAIDSEAALSGSSLIASVSSTPTGGSSNSAASTPTKALLSATSGARVLSAAAAAAAAVAGTPRVVMRDDTANLLCTLANAVSVSTLALGIAAHLVQSWPGATNATIQVLRRWMNTTAMSAVVALLPVQDAVARAASRTAAFNDMFTIATLPSVTPTTV